MDGCNGLAKQGLSTRSPCDMKTLCQKFGVVILSDS
jgi:hypothetical protein